MKYRLLMVVVVVIVFGLVFFLTWNEDGETGESTFIGQSFVDADYGYATDDNRLLYAVIRSFPTKASYDQRFNDPRSRVSWSRVLVRDNNNRMIPAGRDGTVYLFDGDHLRTMKVKVDEADVSIANCRSMDEIWARFQRFEVHTIK